MPGKKTDIKLSEGEMELLKLLWELGPSPLSQVHQNYHREIGYTTIQTRLNRMVDKGVVTKSDTYPALYQAVLETGDASKRYFEIVQNMFGGSIAPLVAHVAKDRKLTPEEIVTLKKVIRENEKRGQP